MLLLKVFFLASLVRLCVTYDPLNERPLFMAVLYAAGSLVFNMVILEPNPWIWWGRIGLGLLLAWGYFWLLGKLGDAEGLFWLVVILGLTIVLI